MPREVARLLAMVVVLVFAASAAAPVVASAQQSSGGMVTGSGWGGETGRAAGDKPVGVGASGGFGDIAKNTNGTVKTVATVLVGIGLIVAIGVAWAQTSVKTLGFAVLMAILASMAISGKLYNAAEDTGKDLGGTGTTGSVHVPKPADLSAALAAGRVA
ncbi:hypothetical protein GKE82_26155 [Conexibacter sp. W3-3-2]|uniref:hypothetical protein n=1 Tax=Conexibacter sp. W3-3-2 TaxID=2675227 RepID=UPI0012B9F5C6|nr:hypothetical protein [Conexibacter sp. W3-3-2]MTD47603.1 hypothetical protein [Conexibacter sp. W3-3-2]MTD47689.1 hypothetical protein [Conexibacter sp. W3-3-2]